MTSPHFSDCTRRLVKPQLGKRQHEVGEFVVHFIGGIDEAGDFGTEEVAVALAQATEGDTSGGNTEAEFFRVGLLGPVAAGGAENQWREHGKAAAMAGAFTL